MQGPHSNCILKFPVFSLSDRKFFLCQFTWCVTITYTKLTWQMYPSSKKTLKLWRQVSQYSLSLESGNLQLEQTKFSVFSLCFGKISKFPVFSLTGIIFGHFPLFSLCSRYPVYGKHLPPPPLPPPHLTRLPPPLPSTPPPPLPNGAGFF